MSSIDYIHSIILNFMWSL